MASGLHQPSVVEDEDQVCVPDAREAVGDHDRGAVVHERAEAGPDLVFRVRVHAGKRVVARTVIESPNTMTTCTVRRIVDIRSPRRCYLLSLRMFSDATGSRGFE